MNGSFQFLPEKQRLQCSTVGYVLFVRVGIGWLAHEIFVYVMCVDILKEIGAISAYKIHFHDIK